VNDGTSIAKVHRGDILSIAGHPYEVRNVVPRDEKQHVIGWIELDPGPAPAPPAAASSTSKAEKGHL